MNLEQIITTVVYDYLWGTPLIVIVLAVGLYLTIRTGFMQITMFSDSFKQVGRSLRRGKAGESGIISSFQAMSMALGTTIGVGNIGGVATAIAMGGPGAVFWMWIAGIFGLVVKTVEITLAVYYRSKDNEGNTYGGPNYYIHKGIGVEKKHKHFAVALGAIFAFGYVLAIFINIQTYTVSEAVAGTFNLNMNIVAIVYTIALYFMISGGIKQLGKIATIIVPFMCIFYIVGVLAVIIINLDKLPESIALIFKSAFTTTAAIGGFAGAGFSLAIKSGLSRSVFSNEAGWGSAPMIHASAKVNHPIKQGVFGIFEVFFDTIIICTLTALVIIISGAWHSGLDGATLTLSAFETGMGSFGRILLTFGIFFFGLTTSSGVYTQIEVVLRYILGNTKMKERLLTGYKWFYPIPSAALVFIASKYGLPGTSVWLISDAATAFPIFANMIAMFILTPVFIKLYKDYRARYKGIGKIDENYQVFYEGDNKSNQVDEPKSN